LKQGDSIRVIAGEGDPFRGKPRGVIAALLCCGAKLYGTKPLVDFVEDNGDGQVARKHRWAFDADTLLEFRPSFATEGITIQEFARRFESDAWCAANPHHPISHMRAMFDQLMLMEEKRKTWRPGVLMRNGDNFVILGPDMSEVDKQEAIAKLAAAS
jgi:hypothetical protein